VSVLQRKELEDSPLADLHAIASELGIEGYRALRRDDVVAAILDVQGGGSGEARAERADKAGKAEESGADEAPEVETGEREGGRRRRGRASGGGRGGRSRAAGAPRRKPGPPADAEPEPGAESEDTDDRGDEPEGEPVTGTLDILANGSGFVRVLEAGHSPEDAYISPAQIRRCELRAGDVVAGPRRPARRNERHPSLVRVETVNGRPAEPPEQRPLFDELTPVHPRERLGAPDVLGAVPFGLGSRVAVSGSPGAGASRLLRGMVGALRERHPDLPISVVLIATRPEEVTDWRREAGVPVTGGSFDQSLEAQAQDAELAVERAKRIVERGGDAVVVIDSLEGLPAATARRVFGAARKAEEAGSLTVIAATGMAWEPQRQAGTRVMLEAPGEGGETRVAHARSGTQRADLLG